MNCKKHFCYFSPSAHMLKLWVLALKLLRISHCNTRNVLLLMTGNHSWLSTSGRLTVAIYQENWGSLTVRSEVGRDLGARFVTRWAGVPGLPASHWRPHQTASTHSIPLSSFLRLSAPLWKSGGPRSRKGLQGLGTSGGPLSHPQRCSTGEAGTAEALPHHKALWWLCSPCTSRPLGARMAVEIGDRNSSSDKNAYFSTRQKRWIVSLHIFLPPGVSCGWNTSGFDPQVLQAVTRCWLSHKLMKFPTEHTRVTAVSASLCSTQICTQPSTSLFFDTSSPGTSLGIHHHHEKNFALLFALVPNRELAISSVHQMEISSPAQ